jgi:hypothetical protein
MSLKSDKKGCNMHIKTTQSLQNVVVYVKLYCP